jgi:hypothetical protein
MAYDYSSDNQRLELPNPYRVENAFLLLCALMTAGGGLAALFWARGYLQHGGGRGVVPVLIGMGLLAAAIGFSVHAARRLRFFFGRGRPASLAPEVAVGATGNSQAADQYKSMLRQGGLEYPEPQGAMNGVLYHAMPRLITAPLKVQSMAQTQFFNALSFAVTFLSFVVGWWLLGTDESRPLIAAAYLAFAAVVLLKPLYAGERARMSSAWLIGLAVVAVVGPVLVGWAGRALPALTIQLHGQAFFLLLAALIAVGLILLSLYAQVDGPPATERSQEQLTLSMNGPPAALITELDRRLQASWSEGIPNRRYTRLEPNTPAAEGAGRFAGELMEETQPLPLSGTTAPTLLGALRASRHRGLVLVDLYATLLVAGATALALLYVRSLDPDLGADGAMAWGHAPVGYSLICMAVAAFCFQSASAIWGRFNFESVLVWVELLGTWQTSRIGTGNQLSSQLRSDNEVVRVESMTLRVWRARIESVVFGKDDQRQVTAMFSTAQEARQMAADLADFAGRQSIFVAPGAPVDQQRMMALKASEQALGAASPAALGGAAAAHEALRVEAAHGPAPRFCTACGAAAPPAARFCAQCGSALQGVEA